MKNALLPLALILVLLPACAKSSSTSPSCSIEWDGKTTTGVTSYGKYKINGAVKNVSDGTVYNTKVSCTITQEGKITDTAYGFPANLGDIKPGESATYEAIAFDADATKPWTYSCTADWLCK